MGPEHRPRMRKRRGKTLKSVETLGGAEGKAFGPRGRGKRCKAQRRVCSVWGCIQRGKGKKEKNARRGEFFPQLGFEPTPMQFEGASLTSGATFSSERSSTSIMFCSIFSPIFHFQAPKTAMAAQPSNSKPTLCSLKNQPKVIT